MKFFAGSGVVSQQLTRFELWSVIIGEGTHEIHVLSNTDLIQVTKGPATEWSKACAKDQSNVTNDRIRDNFILQALGGLIDKTVLIE